MKAPKKERDLAGTAAFEVALQHIVVRQDRSYHFFQLLVAISSLVFTIEVCFVFVFTVFLPFLAIKQKDHLGRSLEYTSPIIMLLSGACLILLRSGKKRYAIEPGEQLMCRLNSVVLEPCLGMYFDCETGKLWSDEIWATDVNLVTQSDYNSQAASRCVGRRIVAVGDLHGDLNQTVSALMLTGLVDRKQHWVGNDTYFVQLGDVLDRGPDDILIVRFLMRLRDEARAVGGDVIQLLGNHEIRNLIGDYAAVDPESLAGSGWKYGRDRLLSNKTELGMYLRTRRAIFHYHEFLFMHGGISAATGNIITGMDKVKEFNDAMEKALVNNTITPLGKIGLDMSEDDKVANSILVRSILNVPCAELKKVLNNKFPGIRSVVVGHVPHNARDFSRWRRCGGRLIAIDFGLSRWKDGNPGRVAALEVDSSGRVQLMKSTINYTIFEQDLHLSLSSDTKESISSVRLAGAVVLLILLLGLLGLWAISFIRNKPLSEERQGSYGSISP